MKYSPAIVLAYYRSEGLPDPIQEHRFHPARRWRFDFAWPARKVALEVEGGLWLYGRHNRPGGMIGDMEKYNSAAALGWRILRVQPKDLCTLETVKLIKETMKGTKP